MKCPKKLELQARLIAAVVVCAALTSVVSMTAQASRQATLAKQAEFNASASVQLAHRERHARVIAA